MNNSSLTNQTLTTGRAPLAILASFVYLIPACFANLFAIAIFQRSVSRGGPVVNSFLLCLSCTDFLGCLYGIQATVAPFIQEIFTTNLCEFVSFMGTFCALLSAFCAALLAIDRYFALCKPYVYGDVFNRKRSFIYVGVIITLSVFVCLTNVMGLGVSYTYIVKPNGSKIVVCSTRIFQEEHHRRVFGFMYGILGFMILLTVIFCNVKVILTVLKMKRNIQTLGSGTNGPAHLSQSVQAEVKFARVIIGLSITLLICWGPFMTNAFLAQLNIEASGFYLTLSHMLVSLNFMVDPFVFLLMKTSYREEAAQLLCCCCQKNSQSNEVTAVSTQPFSNQNKEQDGVSSAGP